jgi:hypothetical protein
MTFEQHNEQTVHFDQMSIKAYLDAIGMQAFYAKASKYVPHRMDWKGKNNQPSIFLYLFSANTAQGFPFSAPATSGTNCRRKRQ